MATIVAAAGGGNWTAAGTWTGGVVPTAADDVQLGASSGNVTIDSGAVCRSLDCTGYTGTLTHVAAYTLPIGDATAGAGDIALKFVAGMTYTLGNASSSAIRFISTNATQQTIDFAGKLTGNVTYQGVGSSYIYSSGHSSVTSATLTLSNGTLNTNGQTVSIGAFASIVTTARTLTLGSSVLTFSVTATPVNITTTGLTITANSSTWNITGSGGTVAGGGMNFNGATFVLSGSISQTITGANTFGTLTRTGTNNKTDNLILSANQTAGTVNFNGNSATNRLLITTSATGTSRTITATTVNASNVDLQDMTGAGTATWDLTAISGKSGDCGGNSNITFTASATQTWNGTSGGNWSTNAWSGRVPLPQDDVVFSNAFSASQTVNADMPRLGRSINWTGTTGNPTWNIGSTTNVIYGSMTLISGMSLSGSSGTTLSGRGSYTLTSAGKNFTNSLTILAWNGTYTLADNFSSSASSFTVTIGTFNANNFNMTVLALGSSGTSVRSIIMGSGTWTITQNGAANIVNIASTNLTFSGASATIVLSVATANTRTFVGGGFTYGTLTYVVAGSTGTMVITGANTFNTINFSDTTNARTLTLPASTTTTITSAFNVNGTAGKLMTINSSTAGTTATLSKASGIVSSDYLSLQDSTATGGASWYAGTHSTSVSNNSGWQFIAPPVGSSTSGNFFALFK